MVDENSGPRVLAPASDRKGDLLGSGGACELRLNSRWAELHLIEDGMLRQSVTEGSSLPTGVSSMPFYMAVAQPVSGAILGVSRSVIKSPAVLSKAAFAIDRMKHPKKGAGLAPWMAVQPEREEEK